MARARGGYGQHVLTVGDAEEAILTPVRAPAVLDAPILLALARSKIPQILLVSEASGWGFSHSYHLRHKEPSNDGNWDK